MSWELVGAVSEYVVYLCAGVVSWAASVEGRLYTMKNTTRQQQRRLEGDDNDPNNPGALKMINNVREDVEHLESQLEQNRQERKQEHRQVVDQLESLEQAIDGDHVRADGGEPVDEDDD